MLCCFKILTVSTGLRTIVALLKVFQQDIFWILTNIFCYTYTLTWHSFFWYGQFDSDGWQTGDTQGLWPHTWPSSDPERGSSDKDSCSYRCSEWVRVWHCHCGTHWCTPGCFTEWSSLASASICRCWGRCSIYWCPCLCGRNVFLLQSCTQSAQNGNSLPNIAFFLQYNVSFFGKSWWR